MKVKQVINNNIIFSEDSKGNEIIVVGKGIGFNSKKGDEVDDSKTEKIFMLKDETEKNKYMQVLEEIPYQIISFGLRVTDYIAACSSKTINKQHLMLPLVDHLYTTLERYKNGVRFDHSVLWNIRYLYKEEFKIAQDVKDMMISAFGLPIEEGEANYITLHIINAELDLDPEDGYKATSIIEITVKTVEENFGITLNKDSSDFGRFVTHLQFFAKRMIKNTFWEDEEEMSRFVRHQYKEAYQCAQLVISRLDKAYSTKINENECSYLTIHIARLLKTAE